MWQINWMVNEFFLIHHEKNQKNASVSEVELLKTGHHNIPTLSFETCLRKIHLSKYVPDSLLRRRDVKDQYQSLWQLMEGETAYSFILEILAGLHSPMVGETEVLGQFKNQMQIQKETVSLLNPWINWMYEDVKKVRTQCLRNLGSQTYGSWVRTLIPRERPLVILGAGQMCQKIYPYLQNNESSSLNEIFIVTRTPEKVKSQYASPVFGFNDLFYTAVASKSSLHKPHFDLIVAAPISNENLRLWLDKNPIHVHNYLDMRGENEPLNSLNNHGFKMGLKDFFQLQEQQKRSLQGRIQEAKAFIKQLSQSRFEVCFHRPWGWEDVCS